jgi:hypothetical protein
MFVKMVVMVIDSWVVGQRDAFGICDLLCGGLGAEIIIYWDLF